MNLNLPQAQPLGAVLAGFADLPAPFKDLSIGGLASDSRRVNRQDLFCALRGRYRHGLEFYAAVRAAGAAAVAWESPYDARPEAGVDCPLIEVEGLSRKLGLIADRFHGQPSRALDLVGVTGTDGKTSCTHYIAQALHEDARPCGLLGTLGYGVYGALTDSGLTTPDALTIQRWLADARARGARWAAMEVSSHALDQHRVAGLNFAVAVLTNLTRDHLDYHGDLAAYAAAKRRLFVEQAPRFAVVNGDDEFGRALIGAAHGQVVTYGLEEPPAVRSAPTRHVWGRDLELSAHGLRLQVISSWGDGVLAANLMGRFNASNLLAALAALLALDIPLVDALRRLGRVENAPGRMERIGGERGQPLAIVDYAHTPHALEQVLQALREHSRGRLWCVFGCGGDRDPGKRPLMGAIAERWADRVIVTDDNPRTEDPRRIIDQVLAGMRDPGRANAQRGRAQAIAAALAGADADDIVLIAGKGHEDYQIIGAERLRFSDREVARQCLAGRAA